MIIFNGKRWAQTEEEILKTKVDLLKYDYDITPHLVSILVGDNKNSKIYSNLKMQASVRIGAKFTIKIFEQSENPKNIINFIKLANKDQSIHGIMVQLPLPKKFLPFKQKIINTISKDKDVDGLKNNSDYIHPTAKAIYDVLTQALILNNNTNIVLIGSKGMVGANLSKLFQKEKINFTGIDINDELIKYTPKADIIISATGKPNLINRSLIKKGVSLIDVGYPKGDINKSSVKSKAKFITPVPGGIGPVTISVLLDNLVASAQKNAAQTKQ